MWQEVLQWLSQYGGAVLGAIGAITGVASAFISVKSYRMANSLKALDLRLEAHRARNDLEVAVSQLVDVSSTAITSRERVSAARGLVKSGAMQRWKAEWQQDQQRIEELSAQVSAKDISYEGLSAHQLEATLVELHQTKGWVDDLAHKYKEWLAEDDRQRARIVAPQRQQAHWK